MRIFYFNYQYYFNINKTMKISSPFVDYIPDCKRNMRRLRKKIYKFITSKNYHKKHHHTTTDLMGIFSQRTLPQFVIEQLTKRKGLDLSAIKNLSIPTRLPLKEITAITQCQEKEVSQLQQEWLENNQMKSKLKALSFLDGIRERESSSKRTLSSTEFEYDEEEQLQECSSDIFAEVLPSQVGQNFNQDIQFHHFQRGNSFLQIESSILSQENLFKFQQ